MGSSPGVSLCLGLLVVFVVCQVVQGSWWYLGVLGTSGGLSRDTRQIPNVAEKCSNSPYLEPKQRELCAKEEKLLDVIGRGASMGIEECQHQFQNRRWNCSIYNNTDVFGNLIKIKSRETAYIYAISSAGITHSVTRACAKGELEGCGCDDSVRQKATGGEFEWGGCSENLKYGGRFAEEFVDSKEVDVTENGMMNLWNNKAGRLVTKKEVDLVCKCHGVSGSCSIKICWRKMKPFREIGTVLKQKFDGATLVHMNKKKNKLRPISRDMKRPTRQDLVYLEHSPNFCNPNAKMGSLGTKGRKCDKNSYGLDGCNLMCCGRGYYTIMKTFVEDCECKFVWCCRVDCKKCRHTRELHFCN